jgi:hypothetical protein
MSQKCHKLTHAPQQRPALFDHFVDDRVYPWRYRDALAPKHTREASGRSGNPSRQVQMFRDVFLIAELLDSKAESDDVGLERSWMSCQIERAFRFVEVLKKAAADPSNRSSIDPPLFRLSRSGSNSCCQSSLSIVS